MFKFFNRKKETPVINNPFVIDTTVTFNLEGFDKGHHQTTYRGVPCVKSPFDYVIYQMIIEEVKPDLIIEIGTYQGGSAYYFADLLELIGKGVVHTIDVEDKIHPKVREHKRVKFFLQDWQDYDLDQVKDFKSVLVIEDGSHKYPETMMAMAKFSSVVSVGSYLIVEDGIIDALGVSAEHNGGPVKAIRQFMRAYNNFEIAYNWCDFFGKNATFNVVGYLRRVK